MKKIFCLLLTLLLVGGCSAMNSEVTTTKTDGEIFKEEYESLNGLQDIKYPEYKYRTVEIDADNPYVLISLDELIDKINNKESFYVYFGDPKCPWCRSNIESAVAQAKEDNISTIYYLHMWDDERNEIVRDKYEVVDGTLTKTKDTSDNYYKLLDVLAEYLDEYIIQDDIGNEFDTGEKRIVMPSYVHFYEGQVDKYTEGTAKAQDDSHEELSEEIIDEQNDEFSSFFNQNRACSLNSKGC